MTIKLYSKFHTPIDLNDNQPTSTAGEPMSKAKSWSAAHEGNEFLFQEIEGDGFLVRFNRFMIKQPTSFTITTPFTMCFQISLLDSIHYELAGYGNMVLHKRHYNIVAVPSYSAQFKISNHTLLLPFEVFISLNLLEPLRKQNHHLDYFLINVKKGRPVALFNKNPIASTEMLAMIDLIANYCKAGAANADLLNAYVKQLLSYALAPQNRPTKIKCSQGDINNIYKSEKLLIDIVKQPISWVCEIPGHKSSERDLGLQYRSNDLVHKLAETAGISVYSFTNIFKQVFGYSLHNYRKEIQWQIAMVSLLEGSHNLKTISSITGYSDQPSFCRAFKGRFSYTPSEFVQEMKKKLEINNNNANTNTTGNLLPMLR